MEFSRKIFCRFSKLFFSSKNFELYFFSNIKIDVKFYRESIFRIHSVIRQLLIPFWALLCFFHSYETKPSIYETTWWNGLTCTLYQYRKSLLKTSVNSWLSSLSHNSWISSTVGYPVHPIWQCTTHKSSHGEIN